MSDDIATFQDFGETRVVRWTDIEGYGELLVFTSDGTAVYPRCDIIPAGVDPRRQCGTGSRSMPIRRGEATAVAIKGWGNSSGFRLVKSPT